MSQWKEVRFFLICFWLASLLLFCYLASSIEGEIIAIFLYPMASIAASFCSLVVVTDREGVDAERVYLPPTLFPRFPNFHFSCRTSILLVEKLSIFLELRYTAQGAYINSSPVFLRCLSDTLANILSYLQTIATWA